MWRFRRVLNISWVDKVTNVDVLRRTGKGPEAMNCMESGKLPYFWTYAEWREISALTSHNSRKNLREEEQGKT